MTDRHPRLPPGQVGTDRFPVVTAVGAPKFDPSTWGFFVDGEVENPLRMTWREFLGLPRVTQRSDFHCWAGWSRLDDEWEGVLARTVVEMARPKSSARYALLVGEGQYTSNLPLEDLLDEGVLLALRFNGQDIEPVHGGPVRALVPKKYGYKSVKWIRGFRLLEREELGYWEARGYSSSADPWREERYA